ncbi:MULTISPECIES: hypothetical protein [unclassified Thiocapsa]|uniref:hypothetical protein n=1 Tax=unclassified Thiocapsa TaxID=2641286 RepID=UPI0035AE7E6E
MAIMTFNIPDNIAKAEQQCCRQAAFEQLTAARPARPALTEAVARAARESARP